MNRNGISGNWYLLGVLSLVLSLPGCGGGGGSSSSSAEMDARSPARTPVVTPPAPPSTTSSTSTTTSVVTPPPPSYDWPDHLRDLDENTGKIISSDAQPLWEGVDFSQYDESASPAYSDAGGRQGLSQIIGIKDGITITNKDGTMEDRDGWTLFYSDKETDATTEEVEFEFHDHTPAVETHFVEDHNLGFDIGFERFALYSPITRPPYDDSFFDHHSVKVWSFENFAQGASKKRVVGEPVKVRSGAFGFFVHGQRAAAFPMRAADNNTLTYRGDAGAYVVPRQQVSTSYYSHSDVARYEGDLELNVDFRNPTTGNVATVNGRIYNLEYREFDGSSFQKLPDTAEFVIENGMVSSASGTFTATIMEGDENEGKGVPYIQFTGESMSGRFYGGNDGLAEEVGGTFRGTDTTTMGSRRVIGWFGGAKE